MMSHSTLSRRHLLKGLGLGAAGLALPACSRIPGMVGEPPPKPFSIVLLPDTQCYADVRCAYAARHWGNGDLRQHFYDQTDWIRDNQEKRNIAMVAHAGDITQMDFAAEWEIADKAFQTLDGRVPYTLCLGNHDMGFRPPGYLTWDRSTNVDNYFPPNRFRAESWYGGSFAGSSANSFTRFEAGGLRFLLLALEFKPRDCVLDWANAVLSRHPSHRAIFLTHAYLGAGAQRIVTDGYRVSGNPGEALWQKCVSLHRNAFLVLCGHVASEALLTCQGAQGNTVHQMLADYQTMQNGGSGYLRILTFKPLDDRIEVETYSPSLDKFMTEPQSAFTLDYPMLGAQAATKAA